MTGEERGSVLSGLIEVAREAGRLLLEGFERHSSLQVERKDEGVNNLVTEMDLAAEKLIRSRLDDLYGARFMGEESAESLDLSGAVWIVDPIDGTVNYARGIPMWTISIALTFDGLPQVGIVYEPVRDRMYSATLGGGAFCNDRPIHVSATRHLPESVLVTGFPYNVAENPHRAIDTFSRVLHRGIAVRRLGSAALDMAYVAAGIFDGFWEVALKPWDVAAGILLVREAGGVVGSYAPAPADSDRIVTDRVIGSNGHIHDAFYALIADHDAVSISKEE